MGIQIFEGWCCYALSYRGGGAGAARPGSKAVRSTDVAALFRISWAIASPVAGALRIPQTLWPVAK
jgi:hypothetical protein